MTQARANIRSITLPLFMMHGDQDVLVPITASQFIRENVGSQDVQYEVSENGVRHASVWIFLLFSYLIACIVLATCCK